MVMAGLALGMLGAFALTRVMKSLLFEVSPLDPIALIIEDNSRCIVATNRISSNIGKLSDKVGKRCATTRG